MSGACTPGVQYEAKGVGEGASPEHRGDQQQPAVQGETWVIPVALC